MANFYRKVINRLRYLKDNSYDNLMSIILRIHYRNYGIKLGENVKFLGNPSFNIRGNGKLVINNNCRFRSRPRSNALGINHPCIITVLGDDISVTIGENCGFSGVSITAEIGVEIGNNLLCGANVTIADTDFHVKDSRSGDPQKVVIKDNVWIGMNTVVLKGVTIGENTLIGANSIVTKDIPENVIATGSPCKVIKQMKDATQ